MTACMMVQLHGIICSSLAYSSLLMLCRTSDPYSVFAECGMHILFFWSSLRSLIRSVCVFMAVAMIRYVDSISGLLGVRSVGSGAYISSRRNLGRLVRAEYAFGESALGRGVGVIGT